jgi:hypothetical protein
MSDLIEDGDEPLDEPVIAEAPPVDAPPERTVSPEVEELARKYGWKPKGDSTLPDGSWMDADRFVAASKTRVRILGDELAETNKRAAAAEAMAKSAADSVRRQERARYDSELAALREQKAAAVESADVETYRALEQKEAQLTAPQGPHPELVAYAESEAGKWVKDPVLYRVGNDALSAHLATGVRLTPTEQFAYAAEKVREYFPHKFPAPQPREAETGRYTTSRVDGGGLATGRSTASHGLSAEDYAAATELVRQKVFKDVGAYAAYAKKLGVLE